MNQVILRQGNFNSSEIVALTTNGKAKGTMGKPAYTFIDECNIERRLGRSISTDITARPLTWGNVLEIWGFWQLGYDYTLSSAETLKHPKFSCWVGSPDGHKMVGEDKCIIDIKAPYTLKSFCKMVDSLRGPDGWQNFRDNHTDGEKYYWQLVSNAAITGSKFAELVVVMPYKHEIEQIKTLVGEWPDEKKKDVYWIANAEENDLPYLIDGGYYNHVNKFMFEVPQADLDFLAARVELASNELCKFFENGETIENYNQRNV